MFEMDRSIVNLLTNEVILDGNSMKLRILCQAIADWLSSKIVVTVPGWLPSSAVNHLNHSASWAALERAIYSASAVDNATQDCFFYSSKSELLHSLEKGNQMLIFDHLSHLPMLKNKSSQPGPRVKHEFIGCLIACSARIAMDTHTVTLVAHACQG